MLDPFIEKNLEDPYYHIKVAYYQILRPKKWKEYLQKGVTIEHWEKDSFMLWLDTKPPFHEIVGLITDNEKIKMDKKAKFVEVVGKVGSDDYIKQKRVKK